MSKSIKLKEYEGFEDISEVKKLIVDVEVLYLHESSDVWMTEDGIRILVLRPMSDGPGQRGEAG